MAETRQDNMEQQDMLPQDSTVIDLTDAADAAVADSEAQPSQDGQDAQEADAPHPEPSVSSKERLMRSLVSDDDEVDELTIDSLRQMLDAAPRWFLSQWKMLLLVLAGIFLYVTSGYQAQAEIMKETELEAELKDWRYRSITRVSELTMLCRQSQLEQKLRNLGDTTLLPSKEAPFVIKVVPSED